MKAVKRYHSHLVVTCSLEVYMLNLATLEEQFHWTACDEYAAPFVCLFCLYMNVYVCMSVLQSVTAVPELSRGRAGYGVDSCSQLSQTAPLGH